MTPGVAVFWTAGNPSETSLVIVVPPTKLQALIPPRGGREGARPGDECHLGGRGGQYVVAPPGVDREARGAAGSERGLNPHGWFGGLWRRSGSRAAALVGGGGGFRRKSAGCRSKRVPWWRGSGNRWGLRLRSIAPPETGGWLGEGRSCMNPGTGIWVASLFGERRKASAFMRYPSCQ
jgi:hypothetical protein